MAATWPWTRSAPPAGSGAESATIVYRRGRDELPARAEEVHHAEQEGMQFEFLAAPVEVAGDEERWVTGLRCVRMELGEPDDSGRRRPAPVAGSEFTIECDMVVVAIGTRSNPLLTESAPGLVVNEWGYIQTDEHGMTSLPGVFAGGDIVRGAATVILAMGDGKRAASAIDAYLRGETRRTRRRCGDRRRGDARQRLRLPRASAFAYSPRMDPPPPRTRVAGPMRRLNVLGMPLPVRETAVIGVTTFAIILDYYRDLAIPSSPILSQGIDRPLLFFVVPLATLLLLGERPSDYGLRHRELATGAAGDARRHAAPGSRHPVPLRAARLRGLLPARRAGRAQRLA